MNLKSRFVSYLTEKYPKLETNLLDPLISDQLLSPFQVSLSTVQIKSIKKEISSYWALRNWGEQNLVSKFDKYHLRKPANNAVCMSYDFHINPAGDPELIEINTNASFLALGLELYSFLKLPNPVGAFNENELIAMFQEEIRLCGGKENSVAIIDENPEGQKLFSEFLIYKHLLLKHGIRSDIYDISAADEFKKFSLVYNRYTDFYLQEEKSSAIKELFNTNQLQLSPHPFEYFLLADKERLLDWNNQTEIEKPKSLLKTFDLGVEEKSEIWSQRKNLFFKPKHSFGGKQAYKGTSISRKVFDEVSNLNFIAQQLSAPALLKIEMDGQSLEMKYDLRCFAYKDKLQLIIARIYQGQITNLKTPGGGFACITSS